jgi:hypothetical protein
MKFSTHISEFEPPIPNPQPFVDKAFALYQTITETNRGKLDFAGYIARNCVATA